MDIHFNKLTEKYQKETIDIFNYYIEHTTSAYRSEKVDYDFFSALVDENVVCAYAVMNNSNDVIGFCMLEKYKNIRTFNELGDCMYFIKPEMTGKGVGRNMLSLIENDAKQNGIKQSKNRHHNSVRRNVLRDLTEFLFRFVIHIFSPNRTVSQSPHFFQYVKSFFL